MANAPRATPLRPTPRPRHSLADHHAPARPRRQAPAVTRVWLPDEPAPAPQLSHRPILLLASGILSISLAYIKGSSVDLPVACLAESLLAGLCVVAGVDVTT